MPQILRLLRFYFVLLAVFTIGRWAMGFAGVPYEKGHQVFSLVILATIASAHHAAFARGWLGWRFGRVLLVGLTVGLVTQIVILLSTIVAYMAGLDSYFNHPTALNVSEAIPLGAALVVRIQGLIANSITATIAAALGYLMGGVLPRREDLA